VRVIGVAPPGFEGISDLRPPVAFVPITTFAADPSKGFYKDYGWSWLEILVRRKPGVSVRRGGRRSDAGIHSKLERST
jgi:hypothetical protein